MREHYIICNHCKQEYLFQASGFGASALNDERHCPECRSAINEALRLIPIKFKCVNVVVKDVDIDTVERWDKENMEEMAKRNDGLVSRRVFARLFKRGETQVVNMIDGKEEHKGKLFMYYYWPSDRENAVVEQVMVKENLTGEMKPCRNFDHYYKIGRKGCA